MSGITHGQEGGPAERDRGLRVALAACLFDVLLTGTVAFHSNSLVILGDLLKECGDGAAVLAALLTLRAVRRAPAHKYAYGIGKLENLVSMSIVVLMTASAVGIAGQAFYHLRHPVMPHGTLPGIAVFAFYSMVALAIGLRNRRMLRREHSPIIASQAALWFSKSAFDGLMGLSLAAALAWSGTTWGLYLDPLASLVGVAFMLRSAWAIASESVGDLLDAALEETLQIRILRCLATHFDDYEMFHEIRTRRSGSRIYVELFLDFDPGLPMRTVRERIEGIRKSVVESIPGADVTVIPHEPSPLPAG
ncbi:cation diffusion facilitator family transporter [bacterium]|nr:cation diffusion facilitator family transporter [bacterium]